jgi:uncharacterized protein
MNCRLKGLLIFALLSGCASARLQEKIADEQFEAGRFEAAMEALEAGLKRQEPSGKDKLLYLLDLGLAAHLSARFEESTRYFLEADKISQEKDYTSLSQETSTLLVTDQNLDYKGEEFEKVLISIYLAMNFYMMKLPEDALVEARRVNHKIGLYVRESKRKYQESSFARLLPGLGEKLVWLAGRLRIPDDVLRWKKIYALDEAPPAQRAELLVIFQNGRAPVKVEDPDFHQLPIFKPLPNPIKGAEVFVDGNPVGEVTTLDHIEATAISSLKQRLGAMRAKKVAGVVAKAGVGLAAAKATNNQLLGLLVSHALNQADRADTRSWHWLPQLIQARRIPLPPGTYDIRLQTTGAYLHTLPAQSVTLKANEKKLVLFRYAPTLQPWQRAINPAAPPKRFSARP